MKTGRSGHGFFTPLASSPARPADTGSSLPSEVSLPIAGDDPFADAVTVSSPLRSSIRILVIDDDRTLREGCASLLQVEGYNVTVSGRGDEAIEMLRRSQFDIVLCDLCMTPVSGVEILKAALDIRPD